MNYLGIDPGKNGGICLLTEGEAEPIVLIRMPIIMVGTKRVMDATEIMPIMELANFAVIEKAQAMPKQGTVSMFNYGKDYGRLLGLMDGMADLSYSEVMPQVWKKVMLDSMPKDKNASIIRAQQIYRDINLYPTKNCRKPHDGMAEAFLIAHYAIKKWGKP